MIEGNLNGTGMNFGIVTSRFNSTVTEKLLSGAMDCLCRHGVLEKDITVVRVPGSFEIPAAARRLVEKKEIDAVICLGAVIRGETPHFDYVAGEVARGVGHLASNSGKVVTFGVLTTDTFEQALERAGGKAGNKGWDAALAAIDMVNLLNNIAE
jgi:6,7-dimethyl-8-ribityllumazine synthase